MSEANVIEKIIVTDFWSHLNDCLDLKFEFFSNFKNMYSQQKHERI